MSSLSGRSFGALLALALTSVVACGPSVDSVFGRAVAAGDRAKTAGRHLEAAQAYEDAAKSARDPRDRDHALALAASSFTRANDKADAARILDDLSKRLPEGGAVALRARFDRALLTLETDEEAGLVAMETLVTSHPESALSRRALAIVLERRAGDDAKKRVSVLERVLPKARGSELEERVRYDLALAHEALGDPDGARAELRAIARDFPYPKGALFDDALLRAAEIDERRGRYEAAIDDLTTLLRERETTHLIGSYERRGYLPAAMRIASIYRDRIGDLPKARDAFMRVYSEFTTSTSRDDALFEAALVSRRMGDESATCSAMQTLVRSFPDSRYAACAAALCASLGPGATKPCAEYVKRRIAGDAHGANDKPAD